ncbi:MAG TPA: recombinase family protein [Rhizomicrobium sp.]|jgi:DNA invertase Pin-like site-specific DNA recombinase
MKKHYFAYIRVSTVKQGERGSSLSEQKGAIEAYASKHDLAIAGWFEEMETAAKQGRREFSQMMAALKAEKAAGLIIHKIDRSARNLRDWADLGDLIDRGIDVRFVTDNFDLLSRGGRLSADIQAVVAADYIRNLREEVRKGIYGRLKQGLYPFAAPMGYLNTGKAKPKLIDPVKGSLVRHMFERYATNTVSFEALRHEMWQKGLRNAAGNPLYDNTLTAILNNPFYAGVIKIGTTGETFSGVHEPLISMTLFERVQRILRGKTVPKAKKHHFLLRQMVKCACCSRRTLTAERQKGVVYYRCHGLSCLGNTWRADDLEGIALDHIARIKLDPNGLGNLRDLVEDIYRESQGDSEMRKASLTLQLNRIDDRLTRLTDLLIDEAIDLATFNARKEKLLMERQAVNEELARADQYSPLQDLFEMFERNNRELLRYESMLDDEKRELIDIVCSNFSVCGKNATFTLRTPYKEIAEIEPAQECAPERDDVRARRIFDILKNLAENRMAGDTSIRTGAVRSDDTLRSPSNPPD